MFSHKKAQKENTVMAKPNQQQKDWGSSFGEMVWCEFTKSKFIVIWLGFIILLFLLAIFAPFLANDKPFIIKIDGQWRFPLLRDLNATDYSIFLAAIVALVQLLLVRRNRKRIDPSIRSGVLWRQIFVSTLITIIGIVLLYVFIPRRLDATDYKSMIASGKASDAVFASVPYGYGRTDLKVREQPPSEQHWLGTDDVGSDVLCRLIHGSRISLSVGFVAVGISSIIGIIIGAILGYSGGKLDFLGMRLVEIMMAVPVFFLIITIVAFFPRSLFNIMLIIGLTTWTEDARFVRAEFLKLRRQDFVQAAISLGLPLRSILFRHMLPNAIAPVLVNATFGIAGAIFIEAALSFLGFGVAPPTPSWGQILSLGVSTTGRFLWWLTLFPGLAIFFTVLAYNLVGEALRDAIDPRLRQSR
jgi:peptide/nickel transport system permease protein